MAIQEVPTQIYSFKYIPESKTESKKMLNLWKKFNLIRAVEKKRIIFINQNFWLRPGPRVGEIAIKLYNLFLGK